MKIRVLLLSLVAGTSLFASADTPSPARQQMDGFIAAFNSGDRAKVEEFGRAHMPPDFMRAEIIDQTMQMIETSGGYDVVDVTESSPHALTSHVRARRTKAIEVLQVAVDAAAPERITNISFVTPESAAPTPR
jgi:hypothetical protein